MNHLSIEQQTLLILLRRSLWGENMAIPAGVDWEKLDSIAKTQGILSFAYDGIRNVDSDIPVELLQKWRAMTFRVVANNERMMTAQDKLILWFQKAGITSAILKGSSVSRYYPQPDLRVLGDIDILVAEEELSYANSILQNHGYAFEESDHTFHQSFNHNGVCVELHHNISSYPDSPGGRITKQATESFIFHTHSVSIGHHHFPVLSESDQALCLLLHMIRHMFQGGIGLRQVLDWMMYVHSSDPEMVQNEVLPLFERCGLLQYARVATKVCIRCLGLPVKNLQWCDGIGEEECNAFIDSIFATGNMGRAKEAGEDHLFTNFRDLGAGKNSLKILLEELTNLSYRHFPFTKKCKILLPFFWIFLPLRYMVRAALGLRPKKSIRKVLSSSQKQRDLSEMLKVFEVQ